MKKNIIVLLSLFILIFNNQIFSQEKARQYGILIDGGTVKSIKGTYSKNFNLKGLVKPGTSINVGIRMKVNKNYSVDFYISNCWMNYRDEWKSEPGKNPSFAVTGLNFENNYYFINRRFKLKILFGPGIYYWRFTKDGPFGNIQIFEEEKFRKMSIGGNIGAGVELEINEILNFSITTRYHYILSKDRFFFGDYFSEQGILDIRAGILYYF